MTELRKRVCQEWVIDFNAEKAGKRAGVQGNNIRITVWQMLQDEEMQQYIAELQSAAAIRAQITKDQWIAEWAKLGFSNIRNYMTDDCEVIPLSQVKDAEAIKSIKKTTTESEFGRRTQIEFTLHDKPTGLINIGKHFGWYDADNSQLTPKDTRIIVEVIPPKEVDE